MDIRVDDSREITPGNDEGDTTQPCQPLLIPPKKLLLQSSKGKQTTVESTSPQTIITVFDSYTAKPKQTSDTQRDNRTLLQNMMHSLELANGPSQDVTAVRKISVSSASTSSFDCHKECLNGERQYQNGYQHEEEDDKDDDVVFVEEDSIESKQRQREALLNLYEEASWVPTGSKFKVVYIPPIDGLIESDYVDSVVSKAFSSVSVKPEREDSIHSMAMEIGPTGDEVGQKVVTEPHDESALKIAQLSSSCQERFNHLWAQVNTAVTLEERQTAGQTLLSEYEQNLDEEAVAVIQGLSSSQTDPNIEVVDFPFEDDTQYSDPNEENGAEMAPDTEKQIEDNSQNSDPNVDKDKEALTNEMDGADTALDREEQREYTSPRSAVDSDPLQVNCSQLEPNVAAEKACSAALIAGKEEGLPKEIPFVMSGGLLPESEEVTQQSLLPPRRKRGRPRKHFNNLATPSRPTIPSALFSISQVSSHSNSIYDNGVASPSLKIEDPSISGPFKALPSLGGPIGVSASRRRRGRPRKVPLSEQSQSVSQPSDKSSMSQGSRRSARTPKQVSIFDPTPGKRAKNEPSLDDEEKERLPIKAKRGRPRKVTTTLIAKRPKTSQRASTKKDEGEEDVDEEKEDENEDDDEGAEDEDDAVRERRANQREYNRRYREKVRASEEHRRRKAESQRKWTEKKLRENPLYFVQARMAKNGEVTVQRKKKANKPKASKHTRTRGAGNANRQSRTKYVEPESDE